MENNLISIITPVYNVEKFIVETMDSVRAQTYPHWELLLVEDSCSDRTVEVIREYQEQVQDERIRLIRLPANQGAARARNKGVQESRGRYLSYIDADDLWEPQKLERELNFLQEKKASFVFTGYEFADEQGKGTGKVVHVPETLTYKQALKNTTIFTSTVMFDTTQIPKSELEMPIMKSEDTALWWRILRSGRVAWGLNENLVRYRRSAKTLSSNKLEAIRRIWGLYRQAEQMPIYQSAWYFLFWAWNAVRRRV